jgi:hypothetical protein
MDQDPELVISPAWQGIKGLAKDISSYLDGY